MIQNRPKSLKIDDFSHRLKRVTQSRYPRKVVIDVKKSTLFHDPTDSKIKAHRDRFLEASNCMIVGHVPPIGVAPGSAADFVRAL
ncbi:MAG: hypothetical protein ACFB22_15265 [Rhodothalassiaceae bacterium]